MVDFFQKITDVLDQCSIPYMLSGSVAMSIYIVPRATRDFDFIVHLSSDDTSRFVAHFKEGYYCSEEAVKDAVLRKSMFNIIDYTSGFKADFVVLSSNPFRQEEFKRRKQVLFFNKTIYVVSPEDLLLSKIIWIQELQSAIQIEDIKNLSALDGIDWGYVKQWINKLKLNTFGLIQQ